MRRNESSLWEQQNDDHAVEWMKTHTIQDLKLMAFQMDQQGEDSLDIWGLINDLRVMSN